jgi:hypothetical protein
MTAPEESASAPVAPPVHEHPHGHLHGDVPRDRPNRLYQTAAWVAIIAGILFIVGAVFLTGFMLGRHSGTGGWGHHARIDRMGPPMGPGMMGPGMMGPGMMGPGMMAPGDSPRRPAPSPSPAPPPRP